MISLNDAQMEHVKRKLYYVAQNLYTDNEWSRKDRIRKYQDEMTPVPKLMNQEQNFNKQIASSGEAMINGEESTECSKTSFYNRFRDLHKIL